jgi:hypothetical protein
MALIVLFTVGATGQPEDKTPPIDLVKAMPEKSVFKDAAWDKPIVIKSAEEAAKHFDKRGLGVLTKEVDFKKQYVLVFAWRGSGKDQLSILAAAGVPDQLTFALQPGLTRDLRFHSYVYALRSNVKWSTAKGVPTPPKVETK